MLSAVAAINLYGQNTTPYWSLAGNSNGVGTAKLGTTNSIPLTLITNNVERMRIDPTTGRIAVGASFLRGKLTLVNNGSTPSAVWVNNGTPLFTGFAEATGGNGDYIINMASDARTTRANYMAKRARGTLANPLAVIDNDFITSIQASGYDGTQFQNPATIDFFVDGTPSAGNVPVRISMSTGANLTTRKERLKIGNSGNIDFNSGQLYVDQANGNVGIGTYQSAGKLTIHNNGSLPSAPWLADGTMFTGFAEDKIGGADFIVNMATNTPDSRPVFMGKRSRGTLGAPLPVVDKDKLFGILPAAFDGKSFQVPASIDFIADGAPTAGSVPTRIAFFTGANGATRKERFSIGSNGSLNFNSNQLLVSETATERIVRLNNGQVVLSTGISSPAGTMNLNSSKLYINMDQYEKEAEKPIPPDALVAVGGNMFLTGGVHSENGSLIMDNGSIDLTGSLSIKYGGIIANSGDGSGNRGKTMIQGGEVEITGEDSYINLPGPYGGISVRGTYPIFAKGIYNGRGWEFESRGLHAEGNTEGVYGRSYGYSYLDIYSARRSSGVYGFNETIGVGVRGTSNNGLGVLGSSKFSHGIFGTTESDTAFAGYFSGKVFSSNGYFSASDKNLKKNIKNLPEGLDIINKLEPKSYEFRNDGAMAQMNLPKGKHFGLLAQDVEKVLPTLVHTSEFDPMFTLAPASYDSTGKNAVLPPVTGSQEKIAYKAINYTELIPVLVKGMQEQQSQIEEQGKQTENLMRQVAEQQKQIEDLKAIVNKLSGISTTSASLSSAKLGNPIPNPSKSSTVISYNVPEGSRSVFLLVTDMKGALIKQVKLNAKGSSQINLNTTALAAGTYTYNLIVDGTKQESKQLIITR
ncbi:hypothetical protein BUE76_07645 [Cnuella takakiae]|nr:hypothetical protein BUE76_07645 [Cnuella takakiae]